MRGRKWPRFIRVKSSSIRRFANHFSSDRISIRPNLRVAKITGTRAETCHFAGTRNFEAAQTQLQPGNVPSAVTRCVLKWKIADSRCCITPPLIPHPVMLFYFLTIRYIVSINRDTHHWPSGCIAVLWSEFSPSRQYNGRHLELSQRQVTNRGRLD